MGCGNYHLQEQVTNDLSCSLVQCDAQIYREGDTAPLTHTLGSQISHWNCRDKYISHLEVGFLRDPFPYPNSKDGPGNYRILSP